MTEAARVPLMTIERTGWLEGNGLQMLTIHPTFPTPRDWNKHGWGQRTERVLVVTPEGRQLEATARINVIHVNFREPHVPIEERWPIAIWLTDRRPEEIPVGSKIFVSPEVRDAILPDSALPNTYSTNDKK